MNIVLKWVIKYVLIIKNEDLSTHIYLKHLISPNCFSKSNKSKKKTTKIESKLYGPNSAYHKSHAEKVQTMLYRRNF